MKYPIISEDGFKLHEENEKLFGEAKKLHEEYGKEFKKGNYDHMKEELIKEAYRKWREHTGKYSHTWMP